jgi:hypothetical protein
VRKIIKLAVIESSTMQMSLGLGLQMNTKKMVETTHIVWRRKEKKLDHDPVELFVIIIERSFQVTSHKLTMNNTAAYMFGTINDLLQPLGLEQQEGRCKV